MSLATLLQDAFTRAATQDKHLKTLINGNAADLSALATTSKTNLVAALNELYQAVQDAAGQGGVAIDDASPGSTISTYSASKIEDAILASRNALLGGASAAYDTLLELQTAIEGSATDAEIATITTALGNRVRFDAAQSLTGTQQTQARTNIGAASAADVGSTTTDFVATFEAGLV